MLIGLPMPTPSGIALANAAWQGDANETRLVDGLPARVARMTTAGVPAITLTFAAAFTPRVIALLGLTCPVGTVVSATTGAGGALGGNSAGQAVVQLADGSRACWIVTSGAVATATVKVTINAAGTFDIGELAAMPAVDVPITNDWTEELIDPSNSIRTRGSQVATSKRRGYRQLSVNFSLGTAAQARGGVLAGGLDWQKLTAALAGDARCAAIPRWGNAVATLDAAELHRTAVYGIARLGGTQHLRGPWHGKSAQFHEIPPV